MAYLSESVLLDVWAAGASQHPLDRALTALMATSSASRQTLSDLPLGERDGRLFELYRTIAGPEIRALARCPACAEQVELKMSVEELCPHGEGATAGEATIEHAGAVVRCRQPSSRHLAAAARAPSEADARRALIAASVLTAHVHGEAVAPEELDEAVIERIEGRLAEMSPPAEILLALTCAGCTHAWSAPFDIGDMVWSQIERAAQQLMREVAGLARLYGWSETDVLAMPPARRRFYQELA